MSGGRKLKVSVKDPFGLLIFDGKRKDFRPSAAADFSLIEGPDAVSKRSLELFRYRDQDRVLRLLLLNRKHTWTMIGSLALTSGSPGERSVMELVRNRKAQGTDYDLPAMMSELFAYKYRRRHGEHAARPCPAGEEMSFFEWSVPSVDLGAPRTVVFSGLDAMYLTGCYDQRGPGLLKDEVKVAARALSLAYRCHVALCEFFDSFVDACHDSARKSGRYYSEVPAEAGVIGRIDPGVTRSLFSGLDRAHRLADTARRTEDDSEQELWEAKLRELEEGEVGD
jgi:hypothetical protein